MITTLILILLVAGLVVASRRWPEIEKRLFAAEQGTIPRAETVEPPQASPPPSRPEEHVTPTAGGFMRKKSISSEPDVDPAVFSKTASASSVQPETAQTETGEVIEEIEQKKNELIEEVTVREEIVIEDTVTVERKPATEQREDDDDLRAAPASQAPPADDSGKPGGHVTGQPAMPSQPAFYDATGAGATQSIDDLGREADQAYRDRQYEKAEHACLKILLRDPRNHKYMTRIGQVYQEMGNLEDAKEAYEAAKQLDPKNFFVLNRLSEVSRLIEEKQ